MSFGKIGRSLYMPKFHGEDSSTRLKKTLVWKCDLGQYDLKVLDVEYKPEVDVEELFIHAMENNKVELVRSLF